MAYTLYKNVSIEPTQLLLQLNYRAVIQELKMTSEAGELLSLQKWYFFSSCEAVTPQDPSH